MNALRTPSIIKSDVFIIKEYNQYIIGKFITTFLDDQLGGADGHGNSILFSICVIDMLLKLAVFFQLAKS